MRRTASGRISRAQPADYGTRDAERHRLLLVDGGDPALAGSPLGILLANAFITPPQMCAAEHYTALRAIVFGLARPSVAHDLMEPYDPQLRSDGHVTRVRRRLEAMIAALSPDQKRALDQVTIDQKLPSWFRFAKAGQPLRPIDEAERGHLLGALELLAGGEGVATS